MGHSRHGTIHQDHCKQQTFETFLGSYWIHKNQYTCIKKKVYKLPQLGPYVESMGRRQAEIEWRGISVDTAGKMSGPSPHPFSKVRNITFKISLTSFGTISLSICHCL